jgi:hypothetical protein
VVVEFRIGSGRSNDSGESSEGIPKDIQKSGGSNKGKSIKDWRAGRGAV